MTDIKQAFDIALIRAGKKIKDFAFRFYVTDQTIRHVARGNRRNPKIRKALIAFCEEHAPEDLQACLKAGHVAQEQTKGPDRPRRNGSRAGNEVGGEAGALKNTEVGV